MSESLTAGVPGEQPDRQPGIDEATGLTAREALVLSASQIQDDVESFEPFGLGIRLRGITETKRYIGRSDLGTPRGFYEEQSTRLTLLPERELAEPAKTYLNRCLALTADEESATLDAVNLAHEQASSIYFDDPEQLEKINKQVRAHYWIIAGREHAPIPSAFEYNNIHTARRAIELKSSHALLQYRLQKVTEPHTARRSDVFNGARQDIAKVVSESIQDSAIYRLLESFASQHVKSGDRPLTSSEKTIQESMIGAQVIREFGVQPFELSRPTASPQGLAAYRKYNRAIYQLDEARLPGTQQIDTDDDAALARFHAWIEDEAKALLTASSYADTTLKKIKFRDGGQTIARKIEGANSPLFFGYFVQQMAECVLSEGSTLTYTQALEQSLNTARDMIVDDLKIIFSKGSGSTRGYSSLAWIRQADYSQVSEPISYRRAGELDIYSRPDQMHSAEDLARSKTVRIGEVLLDNRTHEERKNTRIIFELPLQKLPEESSHEIALSVAWGSEVMPQNGEKMPYIPGFLAVAAKPEKHRIIFDFVRDSNGDPYTATPASLTESQLSTVASFYSEVGATVIAGAIYEKGPKTIAELAEIVQQNSTYLTPAESLKEERIIIEGELFTQCTGGAKLATRALENAGFMARTITGATLLPEDKHITLAGHAQVMIAPQNTHPQLIVDFTPNIQTNTGNTQQLAEQPTETKESQEPSEKSEAEANVPDNTKPQKAQEKANTAEIQTATPLQEAAFLDTSARAGFTYLQASFNQNLGTRLNLPMNVSTERLYDTLAQRSNHADQFWHITSALVRTALVLKSSSLEADALATLQTIADECSSIVNIAQKLEERTKQERQGFVIFTDTNAQKLLATTAAQTRTHITNIIKAQQTLNNQS